MDGRLWKSVRGAVIVGCMAAVGAAQAQAGTITVVNPSFEQLTFNGNAVSLSDGQFSLLTTAGVGLPGWSIYNNTGANGGVFNPGTGNTVGGAVPAGNQALFLFNNFGVSQTLATVLAANTTYTLTVAVQDRLDTAPAGYLIELLAGGTVIKSIDHTNGAAPVIPTASNVGPVSGIVDVSIAVNSASVSGSLVGQALGIRLRANTTGPGMQTLFDHVRLDGTANVVTEPPVVTPAVPEAGTMGMLGVCAAVVVRRRQTRGKPRR